MFSISEGVDMAVKIEKTGKLNYRSSLDSVKDASLKQLLEWMAGEEKRHAKTDSSL